MAASRTMHDHPAIQPEQGHEHEHAAATCGCGAHGDDARTAVAVDPAVKDRYCADIMTQISSVHEALRGVSRELMRNHLKHCATSAIRTGEAEAEAMYDELVDLMYKHSR